MREYGSGEVTPHMAVLGLMSQGRSTAAALHDRLAREFPQANYAPNSARTGLVRLAKKGQVRVVREGEEPSQDIYEITDLGLRVLEEWLYETTIPPAPLRDPVQGKLAFVGPPDIGRLIETVRAFEEAAGRNYGTEHGKVHTLSLRGVADRSPRLELQLIRLKYTTTLWGQEAKRLTVLRQELEDLQEKLAAARSRAC
jgi:DNA-binding PadR family transcriptional regulator